MIRRLLAVLLLNAACLPVKNTFAQSADSTGFRRFQLGIHASPDVSYRQLRNTSSDPMYNSFVKELNSEQDPRLSYTMGISACFNFNRTIGIEAGVQYSMKGYATNDIILADNSGNILGTGKFSLAVHYLEIPVSANFTAGRKKLRFIGTVGLAPGLIVGAWDRQKISIGGSTQISKSREDSYNKFSLCALAGIGIDYQLSSRMNLRVQPTFRYGLLTITDGAIANYLYSGGLNVGLYYGL